MWYGLLEDGELVSVKKFDFSPMIDDFDKQILAGFSYEIAPVRVRLVLQKPQKQG